MTGPTYDLVTMDAGDLAAPMRAWAANHPGTFPPMTAAVETDWRWLRAKAAVMFREDRWHAHIFSCCRRSWEARLEARTRLSAQASSFR